MRSNLETTQIPKTVRWDFFLKITSIGILEASDT